MSPLKDSISVENPLGAETRNVMSPLTPSTSTRPSRVSLARSSNSPEVVRPRTSLASTFTPIYCAWLIRNYDWRTAYLGLAGFYAALVLPYGLVACWSSPIKSPEGDVLGTFAMYHRERRGPRPEELKWVDAAADARRVAL